MYSVCGGLVPGTPTYTEICQSPKPSLKISHLQIQPTVDVNFNPWFVESVCRLTTVSIVIEKDKNLHVSGPV